MANRIQRLGGLILCAVSMVGTAGAADLPVKAPPPAPVFNWTGCYVGGYVGGARSDGDMTFTDLGNAQFRSYSGGIIAGRADDHHSWSAGSDSSFIGGGTFGCNWQPVGSPFVLGLEGEAGYMKLEGAAFDPLRSPTLRATTPDVFGSGKVGDWYGMITGRLGYAWDRTLFYVKGGAAFVQVRGSAVDNCQTVATGCGNWVITTRDTSDTITTWTLGGGIEWAVVNNWSIKAEYMFIGLGDSHSLNTCGFAAAPGGTLVGGGQFCFNHEFAGIHTAKVGLNYRFDSYWR
jgi:outer membrane immunogenic protein